MGHAGQRDPRQLRARAHAHPSGAAQFAEAANVFSLLSDPTRLHLVWSLAPGRGGCGNTLTEASGAARPAVSQHLAKLRLAGLVEVRKEGRRSVYSLHDGHLRRLSRRGRQPRGPHGHRGPAARLTRRERGGRRGHRLPGAAGFSSPGVMGQTRGEGPAGDAGPARLVQGPGRCATGQEQARGDRGKKGVFEFASTATSCAARRSRPPSTSPCPGRRVDVADPAESGVGSRSALGGPWAGRPRRVRDRRCRRMGISRRERLTGRHP